MIRRCGNFGFVDGGNGELYSFSIGAAPERRASSDFMLGGGFTSFGCRYMNVGGEKIIPFGIDNDMPGKVSRLLEKFYAGEGIMGKKAGLQWGEGPRLYVDAVSDDSNKFFRQWVIDEKVTKELEAMSYLREMHRCLIDLCHLEGFWVKITRSRGGRLGEGRISKIEHIPARKCRFIYNGDDVPPSRAMVADFPFPNTSIIKTYPLFQSDDPLRYPVSVGYYNIYSYGHDHYSVPRYIGAFDWLELAGTLAPLLATYNANASAISKHIESPQSYWDRAEEKLKAKCAQTNTPYSKKMLEDYKDAAMEKFAQRMSGKENAGKFMHTSQFYNEMAGEFEGWKITSIDNKVKEYIDAQVAICKKAEAAATSGFGLDPSLSNLILDTKLGSGSEKLYALKVYNATETTVADTVLCSPWQSMIDANFPESGIKIGLYRTVVEAERDVSPADRIKANA